MTSSCSTCSSTGCGAGTLDGLLLIGDAAHAMSPVGGVGSTWPSPTPWRPPDALAGPLRAAPSPPGSWPCVQARRWLPAVADPVRPAGHPHRVIAVAVSAGQPAKPPAGRRIANKVPALRRRGGIRHRDRSAARTCAGVCPALSCNAGRTRADTSGRRACRQSMMSAWSCQTPSLRRAPKAADTDNGSRPAGRRVGAPLTVTAPVPYVAERVVAEPVSADRRLRVPLRLREHLPDLVGWLGGVAVRAAARTRPACSGPSWTAAPGTSGLGPYGVSVPAAAALPAGQPDPGDHLADPHRLGDRPRRAGDGTVARHRDRGRARIAAPRWTGTPSTSCCAPCAA